MIGRESKAKMRAVALAVIALDQLNSVSTGSKNARSYRVPYIASITTPAAATIIQP